MREIIFRAKKIKDGKWLYGDLIHNRDKVYIAPVGEYYLNLSSDDFEVDENTIGQFIGFNDVKGNKIFEGDIVRGDYMHNHVITYSAAEGAFKAVGGVAVCPISSSWAVECRKKIIGNIHD